MGVKGLWSLLNPVARPVQIESMEGKRLAIDSSIWLYQFQATMRDKDGRVLVNAHVLGFLRRINKLLFHGIKPVFVFDGGAPTLKRNTIAERKRKKAGAAANHARVAEKLFAAQMRREAVKAAQSARDARAARDAASAAEAAAMARGDEIGEQIAENAVYLEDLEGRGGASVPRPPPRTASSASVVKEPSPDPREERRKKFKKHDPYKLPATDMPTVSTDARPDARLATEAELQQFIDEVQPSDIDVESAEFRALPTEVQYEIIGDMRIRSRQQSGKRLADMLRGSTTALDFSKAQIKGLSQRNALTQQLLTVTDMVGKAHLTIPIRIAAERNREYVLVKRGEEDGGGWALGIREGTKQKPIVVDKDEKPETDSEDESSDESSGVEEIAEPEAKEMSREARRREVLDAITARYAPQKADKPSLDLPVTPFGPRRQAETPLLFLDDDDIVPTANDEALALALQQEELGSDEESADPELARALALSRREAEKTPAEPEIVEDSPSSKLGSDDSMEEVSLVPSRPSTPRTISSSQEPIEVPSDEDEFEEISQSSQTHPVPSPPLESPPIVKPTPLRARSVTGIRDTKPSRPSPLAHSSSEEIYADGDGVAALPSSFMPPIEPGLQKTMLPVIAMMTPSSRPAIASAPQSRLPHAVQRVEEVVPSGLIVKQTNGTAAPKAKTDSVPPPWFGQKITSHPPPAPAKSPSPPFIPAALEPTEILSRRSQLPERVTDANSNVKPAVMRNDSGATEDSFVTEQSEDFTVDEDEEQDEADESRSIEWSRSPSPVTRPPLQPEISATSIQSEPEPEVDEDDGMRHAEDVVAEEDDYARFMAQIKNRDLNEVRTEIDDEIRILNSANKVAMRDSDEITASMIAQIQTLLRHFGIPYITAPMEAEAQCAKLAELGLVDGIITDDSDVFLFGGKQCFKNIFNDAKYAECFLLSDVDRELSLTRERLVSLAYLLGSDYTIGLPGVGPVVALELLANFPGPKGLDEFKRWWMRVQRGQDSERETSTKWRKSFKKRYSSLIYLTNDWPNPLVREAYLYPTTDESEEPFQWGFPKLSALRAFLHEELSWSISKVDDELTPIVQRIARRGKAGSLNVQSSLLPFFDASVASGNYAPRRRTTANVSKRLMGVIKQFREAEAAYNGQAVDGWGEMMADLDEEDPKGRGTGKRRKSSSFGADEPMPLDETSKEEIGKAEAAEEEPPTKKMRKPRAKATGQGKGKKRKATDGSAANSNGPDDLEAAEQVVVDDMPVEEVEKMMQAVEAEATGVPANEADMVPRKRYDRAATGRGGKKAAYIQWRESIRNQNRRTT